MISFSTVELDGHTYDAELLAAPLRAVQARAAAHRRAGTLRRLERALALRAQRLHSAVGPGVCCCGLVLPHGSDDRLDSSVGHLDLDTWRPAYAFVFLESTAEAPYAAVCRCGWRERFARPELAHAAVRDHTTEAAASLQPASR